MRLGILTSHPIQYQAPWFRALAKETDLHVFFAHRQTAAEQGKAGFGVAFDWDIDLLSGYTHTFLSTVARHPSVNHFFGCDTPDIAAIIACEKFDVFIVTGWHLKSYWQAVRASRSNNVPVLVRGDSQLGSRQSYLKRFVKRIIYPRMLKQFDGFLYVGQRNREYLTYYGVPTEKMFFVPHFVDNKWFAEEARKHAETRLALRKKWQCNKKNFVALFVGKLIPEKRISDFIAAVSRGAKHTLSISAVIVGTGKLEQALRKQAEDLRVEVFFEGFKNQSELPAYYSAADVLVLPSGSETWGLVVNEAMACGLPAIVSDAVGCAPDLIEEGRTGFTYPVGDVAMLIAKLEQMVRFNDVATDFRTALREKMGLYSMNAAVKGLIGAVESVSRSRRNCL